MAFGGFIGNIVSDVGKDVSKVVTNPIGAVKGAVSSLGDLPSSIGNFINNPLQSVRSNPDLQMALIAAAIASGGAGLGALGGSGAAIGGDASTAGGGSYLSSLFNGGSAGASSGGNFLSSLFGGGASGLTGDTGAIGSSLPGATDAFGSLPFGSNLTASGVTGDTSWATSAGNLLGGASDASSAASGASGGIGSYIKDGAGILSILSGIQNYSTAAQRQKQQSQYGTQLQQLMSNSSSVTNTPGYQAGLDAVTRTLAAQGYNNSTNAQALIANYGGQAFQQQVQNLQALQGGSSPISMTNASNEIGQGLGSLVSGMGGNTPQMNNMNPQMLQLLLKMYGGTSS